MLRLILQGHQHRSLWTRIFRPIVGCLGLLYGLSACGKPLTQPDCEQLLLRYVELLAVSDRPDSTALERLRFKLQAQEKAANDPQFAHCGRTVSRKQFECAMVAPSTDEFERCLM